MSDFALQVHPDDEHAEHWRWVILEADQPGSGRFHVHTTADSAAETFAEAFDAGSDLYARLASVQGVVVDSDAQVERAGDTNLGELPA